MSTHARIALRGCAIVAACIAAAASERAQADNALEPRIRGLLEKHCESCHDEGGDKGGLSVGELTGDFEKNGVAWKRIHGVVEARIMPPADEEPLSDDDRRHLCLPPPAPGQCRTARAPHRPVPPPPSCRP